MSNSTSQQRNEDPFVRTIIDIFYNMQGLSYPVKLSKWRKYILKKIPNSAKRFGEDNSECKVKGKDFLERK